jgi:hypothetical protein
MENIGTSPFFIGKSRNNMAIFHSYQRVHYLTSGLGKIQ